MAISNSSSSSSSSLLLLLFCFFFFSLFSITTTSTSTSEPDLLLTFKSSLHSPTPSLANWSPSTHLCNWTGITCSSFSPPKITSLNLQGLNLSGDISSSICLLPHLSHLSLADNHFNQPIPLHLSQCASLLSLNLSNNIFWGTIPDQISHLGSLTLLDLSHNHIEGQVPASLGLLKSLQVLNLGSNLFSGSIHPSFFNGLTDLVLLDLSLNQIMSSELPVEIGKLRKLRRIFLQGSGFFAGIPESILGLHELEVLDLSKNNFTGRIPLGFGLGLSKLVFVDLSQNKLYGSFPADVCYGKALVELNLHANYFTGFVPDTIGKCSSIERIQLQDNEFYGEFPSGLWSLPVIRIIRAENNRFSGEIPASLGVGIPSHLEQIQIDNNSFTGGIPKGLGMINSLYRFSASLNGFYGELPENFCDSPDLSIINLSHNSLSGTIPELPRCRKLVSFSLAGNRLTGHIPSSLAHLPVLTYIDLSSNNLSGEIPQELQNLKLALFNVSFNQLSGAVPLSLISGLPASLLQGNPGLCGPGLPNPCVQSTKRRKSQPTGLIIAITAIAFVVGFMLLALGLFAMYWLNCRRLKTSDWKTVFFYSLGINEEDFLMSLDGKNIIGRGVLGDVYVVKLPSGEFVAVKKLPNLDKLCFRTVKAEIGKLTNARHKNLVKLFGFCYSESVILIIHEFMPNGSLGDKICRSGSSLQWKVRLQIAASAAQGLAYLHRVYVTRLLHRNIKANNILLGMDFEPKLAGFGFDHVVGENSHKSILSSELAPRCYLAPEQRCCKKATEQMDVYSFGVVLLELVTGRRAEKQDSEESLDVVTWTRRKINMENGAYQILDPKISNLFQQEMLGVLELALRCVSVMPDKRPTMDEVVRYLQSAYSANQSPEIFSGEPSFSCEP